MAHSTSVTCEELPEALGALEMALSTHEAVETLLMDMHKANSPHRPMLLTLL